MKETSSDPPDISPLRPGASPKAHGSLRRSSNRSNGRSLSVTDATPGVSANNSDNNGNGNKVNTASPSIHATNIHDPTDGPDIDQLPIRARSTDGALSKPAGQYPPAAFSQEERQGSVVETKEGNDNTLTDNDSKHDTSRADKKRAFIDEFKRCSWMIITHSWLNVLLIFVPVGIAVAQVDGIHGGIVFAMNCIAVIPLAGLLAHATESVAHKLGDALAALLNVTFGNAVELIIFIIALSKDQIRIVQASLLGSILANLLLILGMGFFLGGLRFREQACALDF